MHVVGKSMNDIYRQLCGKISVQGHEAAGTKEMLNGGFTLLDITDNIAMSSDEPKHGIAVYCFDNDIITEVNDED